MASVTDIITLESFASKMPPWTPDLPNHLYALVDMGSNGIRFSISDLTPPRTRLLRCVYRERAAISLFDAHGTSSSGPLIFPPELITQVSLTLARFKSIAADYNVPTEHISVFATEAMRKAENAASMLDAILAESGLGVHVLAPEVETLFGAMGARSGFAVVNGLFLDLGGGSVQMTYMNSSMSNYEITAAITGRSLPFGAAKLIRVLEGGDRQAQVAAKNELQAGMRDAFAKLQHEFSPLQDTRAGNERKDIDVYLCGGGFRGYGSMLMHNDPVQPYPIPAIGAYTVDGAFFDDTKKMRKANVDYDGKIFGMSKRRRQQFPAIATVVEALVDAVPRIRTATFCSGGNREGALLMKLPKSVREESPLLLLCRPDDKLNPETLQSVVDTVQSALPTNLDLSNIPTIFTLGLSSLFASKLWTRAGEPSDANAAFEIHQAITSDPSVPGFTHLARAVLGLTLCFRWGASLGPVDKQLYDNLRRLVNQANQDAIFWAEYIGAVAGVLTKVCPAEPKTPDRLAGAMKFAATMANGKKKNKLQLVISLSSPLFRALDPQDIVASFKKVGKQQDDAGRIETKVHVVVQELQP